MVSYTSSNLDTHVYQLYNGVIRYITREEFDKLSSGESPFNDGARNPNIDEDVDEDVDIEIAECLRIAGC